MTQPPTDNPTENATDNATKNATEGPTHPGWTAGRVAAMVALVAAAVGVMLDAWGDIYFLATRHEENSHILLVPIVAAWLVYVRKEALLAERPVTSFLGPAVIALGWGMSSFGYYNATQVAWHLGAVLAAMGAALTFMGWRAAAQVLPAVAVLGFLAPVPGAIRQLLALPLQRATAAATEFIFELFAVEVVRMGNLLTYNGHDIAVAEACNGMRMVWALLLVSFVVAFASPLKPYVRVLILALSPLSALICNVLRMAPTVLAYGHWSQGAADMFHDISGWVMVGVAFLLVLGFVRLLKWIGLPVHEGERWELIDENGAGPRHAAASKPEAAG